MRQKYLKGYKVHVDFDLGESMYHFDNDIDAIVIGTYSELCGGENVDSYSLLLLDDNNIPYNSCSWYKEKQLTFLSDDILTGMDLIERFNFGERGSTPYREKPPMSEYTKLINDSIKEAFDEAIKETFREMGFIS